MVQKLDYEIKIKYCNEINRIKEKLEQLEKGTIYEGKNGVRMDGSLQHSQVNGHTF